MNKLNKEKTAQIINALVEGNSIRATARMCDVAFNTVLKLLPEIGKACAEYQNKAFRTLLASDYNVMKSGHSATPKKNVP